MIPLCPTHLWGVLIPGVWRCCRGQQWGREKGRAVGEGWRRDAEGP